MMKILSLALVFMASISCAHAGFIFLPMKSPPPKVDEIGEVYFKDADWSTNDSEYITIPRSDFLRFFSEGVFSNDFKTLDTVQKMPRDLNKKGGVKYCTGYFATKDGRVFQFRRHNSLAMDITDVNNGTGCLVIKK